MAGIFSYSSTAGSNTSVGGVSIAEGMSPANVNNAIRAALADIATSFADATKESFYNGSSPLAIASGGTNATSAATALSNLGGLAETYRDAVPTAKSGAFTFANSDRGAGIRYTGGAAAGTINPYATTAINVGAVIPIRVAHNASGALAVTPGSGVSLRLAGQTATATSVSFAAGSFGGIWQETQDNWVAYGTGIS